MLPVALLVDDDWSWFEVDALPRETDQVDGGLRETDIKESDNVDRA